MKNKIQILKNLFILPIVSLFIIACNSDGPEIEQPERIYYDQAQKRMNANNFNGAIESLSAIENMYPFGKYAEQAQVELIYAHFMNTETEAAHSATEKFINSLHLLSGRHHTNYGFSFCRV